MLRRSLKDDLSGIATIPFTELDSRLESEKDTSVFTVCESPAEISNDRAWLVMEILLLEDRFSAKDGGISVALSLAAKV